MINAKNEKLWAEWNAVCEALRVRRPRVYSIEELRQLKNRILISCISYKGIMQAHMQDSDESDYVYDKMCLLESRIESLFDEMEDNI